MNLRRLFFIGSVLTALLGYISCRKMDQPLNSFVNENNESRFFNSNRSPDPFEEALVTFVKKENNKKHFVEKTTKQIGYPHWDKGIKMAAKFRTNGRNASDSAFVVYIPFVRDSQNYVNASMVIHIEPGDTSISYLCDWQYSELYNTTTTIADTAEHFAVFFMVLDKHVFGHNSFSIVDSNLFKNGNHRATHVILSDSENTGARNNLITPIEVCQDINVYFNDCPYQGNSNVPQCNGPTGCDQCMLCTSVLQYQFCWTEYIDDGNGGGGGTGSGGSGGGSGSGGGGSTPPECPGGAARTENVTDPCEPGWIPLDDDPPPPPPCDPYITGLQNDATFADKFKSLNNLATTNLNYEKGFSVVDRATNQYTPKEGQAWSPEIAWNIPANTTIEGLLHSHYHGKNSIFSPQDVIFMAEIFLKGFAKDQNNLFFGMTGHNNLYPYLIKVTNITKFTNFAKKIAGETGDDEQKKRKFISDFENLLNSPVEENNTKEFLKMMQKMGVGTGMTLYRGNDDCNQWTKLGLDGFDNIIATNCF